MLRERFLGKWNCPSLNLRQTDDFDTEIMIIEDYKIDLFQAVSSFDTIAGAGTWFMVHTCQRSVEIKHFSHQSAFKATILN